MYKIYVIFIHDVYAILPAKIFKIHIPV